MKLQFPQPSHFKLPARGAAVAALVVLAACGSKPKVVSYDPEAFSSTNTHSRNYEANEGQTCEAARRALLSQGYLVTAAGSELVTGKKAFQPEPEAHVEIEFRVVCAKDSGAGAKKGAATIAFVSALQDRYSLKKANNSASVGVGVLGSVSLPFSSSDDSMVKVASQTVTDERFYERFFSLIDRYLVADAAPEPAPVAAAPAPAAAKPPAETPAGKPADKPAEPLGEPASMPRPGGAAAPQ